jgi:NAD(P)-dependent dehydrogenase (short-subunit alcohol dehydrogenase family)
MVCPGLHSIFSALRLQFTAGAHADAQGTLTFEVSKYDSRFRLMVLSFSGCISGELKAFVRPPPQAQPAMHELLGLLVGNEFSGRRCWVIGGSRGLGELTAKLAAAGGAAVHITYAQGLDDARRVTDDINAARRGRCSLARHVVGSSALQQLADEAGIPDAVFFYATPKIFRRGGGEFDAELFAEFATGYAVEFARLCLWLERLAPAAPVRVFYPSSTAVAARPRGMTEYAMAKGAAELMIDDLNRSLSHVRIIPVRLPRLATDQTATLLQVKTASSLELLLPIVRQLLEPV